MSPFVGMSFSQTQHERQDPSHSKNKKEINKMPKRISHEEHNKDLVSGKKDIAIKRQLVNVT